MPGRAREEAWKEKERGQENRQAEGGAAIDREAGMQRRKGRDRGGAAMDREGGMQRDGSMQGGAAERRRHASGRGYGGVEKGDKPPQIQRRTVHEAGDKRGKIHKFKAP